MVGGYDRRCLLLTTVTAAGRLPLVGRLVFLIEHCGALRLERLLPCASRVRGGRDLDERMPLLDIRLYEQGVPAASQRQGAARGHSRGAEGMPVADQ